MVSKLITALIRAFLVVLLIATPSLTLPNINSDTTHIIMLFAFLAGMLVFIEYFATYPSIVDFRYAAPFNRLRFLAIFTTVLCLSTMARGQTEPTVLTSFLSNLGILASNLIDFSYSPIRLMAIILPSDVSADLIITMRSAFGLAFMISLLTLAYFFGIVHLFAWPTHHGAFNVWVNLPLFDPTTGGDVLTRLQRGGRINIALGILLLFLIPVIIKMLSDWFTPIYLDDSQTLIWTLSAWAFIPANLIMRGMAMSRIAVLIEEHRKRTYATINGLKAI